MNDTIQIQKDLTVNAGTNMPTTLTDHDGTVSSLYGYLIDSSSQKKPRWNGCAPSISTIVGMIAAQQPHKQQVFHSYLDDRITT